MLGDRCPNANLIIWSCSSDNNNDCKACFSRLLTVNSWKYCLTNVLSLFSCISIIVVTFPIYQLTSRTSLINQLILWVVLIRSILVTISINTLSLATWATSLWLISDEFNFLLITFKSPYDTAPKSTIGAISTMGITARFSTFLKRCWYRKYPYISLHCLTIIVFSCLRILNISFI